MATEQSLLQLLAVGMMLAGAVTFVALQFLRAPYGRYASQARSVLYGCMLPGRLAWMLQELPSLLVPAALAWADGPAMPARPRSTPPR